MVSCTCKICQSRNIFFGNITHCHKKGKGDVMNRKKLLCAGLCFILLVACCWGCDKAPEEDPAVAFFQDYLEAAKAGSEEAFPYIYFESAEHEELYLSNPDRILSYEILGSEKINDNLTAITYQSENSTGDDRTRTAFVSRMDGEYKVIRNVLSVPEELSENLVVDNYTIPDGMWIDFDETIPIEEQP